MMNILKEMKQLHPYSRACIRAGLQLTVILYVFAIITYYIAPYTPDYFRTLRYQMAATEVAPVTLGVGVLAAFLSDLVLRDRKKDDK